MKICGWSGSGVRGGLTTSLRDGFYFQLKSIARGAYGSSFW